MKNRLTFWAFVFLTLFALSEQQSLIEMLGYGHLV